MADSVFLFFSGTTSFSAIVFLCFEVLTALLVGLKNRKQGQKLPIRHLRSCILHACPHTRTHTLTHAHAHMPSLLFLVLRNSVKNHSCLGTSHSGFCLLTVLSLGLLLPGFSRLLLLPVFVANHTCSDLFLFASLCTPSYCSIGQSSSVSNWLTKQI